MRLPQIYELTWCLSILFAIPLTAQLPGDPGSPSQACRLIKPIEVHLTEAHHAISEGRAEKYHQYWHYLPRDVGHGPPKTDTIGIDGIVFTKHPEVLPTSAESKDDFPLFEKSRWSLSPSEMGNLAAGVGICITASE